MARAVNAAEKTRFRGHFPGLDVNRAVVTGELTSVYNCISWTVGVTNRWLWPGNSLADFDTFYRGFGLARKANGAIAAWGISSTNMTHGCVTGAGHGPRWESKCGPDLRIQHGLNELVGSSYGHVVAFYDRSRSLADLSTQFTGAAVGEKANKSYLSAAGRKLLGEEIRAVPDETRRAFEAAFQPWKESWFSGGLAFSSNPNTRAVGKEFDALIALGPTILPLVVEKLADPDDFFALQLYDAIQPDLNLLVQFDADDDRILEGEQGRARRLVQHWVAMR